jgi:hypothetical protein
VLAVSEPIAPGEVAVIFALVPSADASLDLRPIAVWRDPPTAAAFDLQRIDVLTIGETLDEIGHLASSVRLVVRNRSAEAARFRAEIELVPDLQRMERQIGNLFDDTWRRGRDAGRAPSAFTRVLGRAR